MHETSEIPASAVKVLALIDDALNDIAKDNFRYLIEFEGAFRTWQNTRDLGFEPKVRYEFYCHLKNEIGDFLIPEIRPPGEEGQRPGNPIDLKVNFPECPVYLELGMYYYDAPGKYGKDCKKLGDVLVREPRAIGILVHFQFYERWDDRVQGVFQKIEQELAYLHWCHLARVPDKSRHFLRLGFGRK